MTPEARWSHLKAQARQATVGQLVDDASRAKDVLGRVYEPCCSSRGPVRMNLAIRDFNSGQIAQGDTFCNGRQPDLKATVLELDRDISARLRSIHESLPIAHFTIKKLPSRLQLAERMFRE